MIRTCSFSDLQVTVAYHCQMSRYALQLSRENPGSSRGRLNKNVATSNTVILASQLSSHGKPWIIWFELQSFAGIAFFHRRDIPNTCALSDILACHCFVLRSVSLWLWHWHHRLVDIRKIKYHLHRWLLSRWRFDIWIFPRWLPLRNGGGNRS